MRETQRPGSLDAFGQGTFERTPGKAYSVSNSASNRTNVTLITGQTVTVVHLNGRTSYHVNASQPMHHIETSQGTYVFPVGVDLSRFDPSLFNIDLLIEQNLTDGETASTPIIVQEHQDTSDPSYTEYRGGDTQQTTGGPNSDRPSLDVAVDRMSGTAPTRALEDIGAVAAHVEKARTKTAFEALRTSDRVQKVYLDQKMRVTLDDLVNVTGTRQARTTYGVSGKNVTVAVLDTGVNGSHPDLQGAVVGSKDFTGEGTTTDLVGHGTHVAGIIAGDGSASGGKYVGVAPNASILNVRVLNSMGYGYTSDIIGGMSWAVNNSADVISMSLSGSPRANDPYYQAVESAVAQNVTVIVSAGNDGEEGYSSTNTPSGVPAAITVGASNDYDNLASFSSRGPTQDFRFVKPDLVAPGVDIVSARAGGTDMGTPVDSYYTKASGTSMSTPAVSGAAALLLEEKGPLTPEQVRSALVTTTDDTNGSYDVYEAGSGRLNVTAALASNLTFSNTTASFGTFTTNTTASRIVSVTNDGPTAVNLSVAASATNIRDSTPGNVTTNRSWMLVNASETKQVRLTINTSTTNGAYSGRLTFTNGSDAYETIFGYVRGYNVTVEKHGANGSSVQYDPVVVFSHVQQPLGINGLGYLTNGTLSFFTYGGDISIWTMGSDESAGNQPVLLSKTVSSTTDTTVTFDESNTVPYSLNASNLTAQHGALSNVSVSAEMQRYFPGSNQAIRYLWFDGLANSRTVRYSPNPALNASLTYLLAPKRYYDGSGPRPSHLDSPSVYLLNYLTSGVTGSKTFDVNVSRLAADEHTFYRSSGDQTYYVKPYVGHYGWGSFVSTYLDYWIVGDRRTQTVYRTPGTGSAGWSYYEEIHDFDWRLEGSWSQPSPGASTTTAVNKHPYITELDYWDLNDVGTFTFNAFFQVDQPAERYQYKNDWVPTNVTIWRNGSRIAWGTFYDGDAPFQDSTAPDPGTTYTARVTADNDGPLSTKTVTEWFATYQPGGADTNPPEVVEIDSPDVSVNNALPTGSVPIDVTVADDVAVQDVSLLYAPGTVSTDPFEDATQWTSATVTDQGAGVYRATIDTTQLTSDTVSIAVRATDSSGNRVTSTTYDAFNVGRESAITGRLLTPDGSPLVNAEVGVIQWDPFYLHRSTETDSNGRFTLYVPNGTYTVGVNEVGTNDGVSDAWSVGPVNVNGFTQIGDRNAPRGYNLTLYANDTNGDAIDVYTYVRSIEGTWYYEYADGRNLDNGRVGDRPFYGVHTREVANGTHEVSVYDSWTHDELGTRNVTVSGSDVTQTLQVDRFNGTDPTGASGLTVVRDLEYSSNEWYLLENTVNVRLFVRNTTLDSNTSVRETLPAGYRYVNDSLAFDGDGGADVTRVDASGGDLVFDAIGNVTEVRYQIEPTDGGRDFADFDGVYRVGGATDRHGMAGDAMIGEDFLGTETVAPNASLVVSDATPNVNTSVTLDASGSTDNADVVEYRWDFEGDGVIDSVTTTATTAHTYTQLGPATPTVVVSDQSGNTDQNATTITVSDQIPPEVDVSASPAQHVSTRNPANVTVTSADPYPGTTLVNVTDTGGSVVAQYDVSDDLANGTTYVEWDATDASGTPVASGTYTVTVWSVDAFGNANSTSTTVAVDHTDPTVAVSAIDANDTARTSPNGRVVYTNGTLSVNATADGTPGQADSVSVRLNASSFNYRSNWYQASHWSGTTWNETLQLTSWTLPDDGNYTVDVKATDLAANSEPTTADATVVVDRVDPELAATVSRLGANNGTIDVTASEPLASGSLNVTVEDPSGTVTTVGMTQQSTTRWNGTFALAGDGQYNVTATGRDVADNEGVGRASTVIKSVQTTNNRVTVEVQPSGLFVNFTTDQEVANSYLTITQSNTPLAPLVKGDAGVNFLNAKLGEYLDQNLSYAEIGIPVNMSTLPANVKKDDVTIRYYDESAGEWKHVETTVEDRTINGTTDTYWIANVTHFSTYGAVATDTAPPYQIGSPTIGMGLGMGADDWYRVRFDYGDELSGVDRDAVRMTYNGQDVTSDPNTVITSQYARYNATDLASGDNTITLTVVDQAGNEQTLEETFTYSSGGNNGGNTGGSTGGGGGGNVPPPSILKSITPLGSGAEVTVQNGLAGRTARLFFDGLAADAVTFDRMDLTYAYELSEFTFAVQPSADVPSGTPALDGALGYLAVEEDVRDAYFETVTVHFAVDRAALPDGASFDDVRLYRYHGGEWTAVDTSHRGSDFEAEADGFGVYAVGFDMGTADLAVTGTDLSTDSIATGESIDVTATVENVGEKKGSADVSLAIDGEVTDTKAVTLDAGESTTVTFTHTFEEAGAYEVTVGGVSAGTVEVTDAEEVQQTSGSTSSPDGQPGFGLTVALAALLVVGLLARRR